MKTTRRRALLWASSAPVLLAPLQADDSLETAVAQSAEHGVMSAQERRRRAFALRRAAAQYQHDQPYPLNKFSQDELLYSNSIGNFSKGLPHDEKGVVDPAAYAALKLACQRGDVASFEGVPMGGTAKLANPLASYAYVMEGADSHQFELPGPPGIASAQAASDLAEVYWRALARDVPFADYQASSLIEDAAKDLSAFSDYRAPKSGGKVAPSTIFRGGSKGDLTGPFISQFLCQPINLGGTPVQQMWRPYPEGRDFGASYGTWLAIQNGAAQPSASREPQGRYIRHQRDLASYVHQDFTYQAFLNAGLILQSMGAAAARSDSPYAGSKNMTGFVTFGGPMVLDLVARVSLAALKAVWCQKWTVYRRLRPEAMAGLVHNTAMGTMKTPIHAEMFKSNALIRTQARFGTLLMPLAYPEGSPLHPSYAGGHATIAGACITVLKALFNERAEFPRPVAASRDGMTLEDYRGDPLTVGGELDKLASNIAFGRDSAGIHYRSDEVDGIYLGEEVALSLLRECRLTLTEPISGFTLTRYDGTSVRI